MKTYPLEERLIEYAVRIIDLQKTLSNSLPGKHLGSQLIRSATSPALNYAEAIAAESKRDFIHKNKIVLKELRESHVCLRILSKSKLCTNTIFIDQAIVETHELICIFVTSINTTLKNLK